MSEVKKRGRPPKVDIDSSSSSFYEQLMTSDSIDNDENDLFKIIAELICNHLTKRSGLVSHKFSIDQDN
jgi:hypothetical protein